MEDGGRVWTSGNYPRAFTTYGCIRLGPSEHRVRIEGLFRDGLDDVPVFGNLAVLDAEDIHDGGAEVGFVPAPVRMNRDEIAVGQDPSDLHVGVGMSLEKALEEGYENLCAVRRTRVVLDVLGGNKLCRRIGWLVAVKGKVVELRHEQLVRIDIGRDRWSRERGRGWVRFDDVRLDRRTGGQSGRNNHHER